MEEVLRVGLLLALKEPAYPRELVLIPRAHDGIGALAHLILPVRGDAVLGGVVHVPGTYLHLEGDALGADDRRVYALVHVGLRRGYIVLEAPRHGLEHIMDDAEDVIAVGYRIDDDAESAEVEDAVYVKVLGIHLAVDAVNVLDAGEDSCLHALGVEPRLYLALDVVHEGFEFIHLRVQRVGYLLIALRVKVLERQILQLPLGALHTETVRDGRVDLHRLKRLGALLLGGLVGHRAHIVQAVGDLDEDDADVLGHGHEHLAQVLHLLVLFAGILHAAELRDALDDVRNGGAELAGNILMGEVRVLDHVVQERSNDGVFIQTHVDGDIRCGDAVRDIRRAVAPLLPGMGDARHLVCGSDAAEIHRVAAALYLLLKLLKQLVRIDSRRGGAVRYRSMSAVDRRVFHLFLFHINNLYASARSARIRWVPSRSALPEMLAQREEYMPPSSLLRSPVSLSTIRHRQNFSGGMPAMH